MKDAYQIEVPGSKKKKKNDKGTVVANRDQVTQRFQQADGVHSTKTLVKINSKNVIPLKCNHSTTLFNFNSFAFYSDEIWNCFLYETDQSSSKILTLPSLTSQSLFQVVTNPSVPSSTPSSMSSCTPTTAWLPWDQLFNHTSGGRDTLPNFRQLLSPQRFYNLGWDLPSFIRILSGLKKNVAKDHDNGV